MRRRKGGNLRLWRPDRRGGDPKLALEPRCIASQSCHALEAYRAEGSAPAGMRHPQYGWVDVQNSNAHAVVVPERAPVKIHVACKKLELVDVLDVHLWHLPSTVAVSSRPAALCRNSLCHRLQQCDRPGAVRKCASHHTQRVRACLHNVSSCRSQSPQSGPSSHYVPSGPACARPEALSGRHTF